MIPGEAAPTLIKEAKGYRGCRYGQSRATFNSDFFRDLNTTGI
jgi:hypothetical protein